MLINKVVSGGLILACLTAAGGGAYLATKHNAETAVTAPVSAAPRPRRPRRSPPRKGC